MANINIDQYTPANPPFDGEGLSRATWDELYRISSSLDDVCSVLSSEIDTIESNITTIEADIVDLNAPPIVSITSSVSVTVGTTDAYKTLFDNTGTESFGLQRPLSQVGTDGVWTCPQGGDYLISVNVTIPTTTDPMWNEPVSIAKLRITGNETNLTTVNGVSSIPPVIGNSIVRTFAADDTVEIELDLTRGTTSGSETVIAVLNIVRVGIAA